MIGGQSNSRLDPHRVHAGSVTWGSQPSLLERRLQSERPVRSMSVVVLGVDPKDLLKVDAPENEKPVQALGPQPDGVDGEEIAGDDPGGLLSSSSEVLHVT
jgi:hypothetical protein